MSWAKKLLNKLTSKNNWPYSYFVNFVFINMCVYWLVWWNIISGSGKWDALLKNIWAVCRFELLWIKLLFFYIFFYTLVCLWGEFSLSGIKAQIVALYAEHMLTFLKKLTNSFPEWLYHFTFPIYELCNFSILSPAFCVIFYCLILVLIGVSHHLTVARICISQFGW